MVRIAQDCSEYNRNAQESTRLIGQIVVFVRKKLILTSSVSIGAFGNLVLIMYTCTIMILLFLLIYDFIIIVCEKMSS